MIRGVCNRETGFNPMAEPATASRRGNRLTTAIVIALFLGIAAGWVSHEYFPLSSAGFAGALSLEEFISHTIPTSVVDAMARNEILQIVVFSVFFGVAMAGLGERTSVVLTALDGVSSIMLRVTGYVMLFAPLAVFGALAST